MAAAVVATVVANRMSRKQDGPYPVAHVERADLLSGTQVPAAVPAAVSDWSFRSTLRRSWGAADSYMYI